MTKKILIVSQLILACLFLNAQNPIVPPGVYIADPSAHVWEDGRMYVYGSWDESPNYYCSHYYKVLSSDDLIHWELSDTSFASIGPNDHVPYSDASLFAPDAQYMNGKYYLYYCLSSRGDGTEGVAVSDSPYGPFENTEMMNLNGYNEIDPCVFIDDDGQGYYIWGQFSAKMAKLKPNMMEIDSTTIVDNVVTEKDHFFHEGSYMVKRNGIYYLVYADVSRGGAPTCLGYSTSESPMGPYTYRGVIIDNKYCDPSVWNNHGSLVEFDGQWYVFYHRATNNSRMMRKACLEPITFTADGLIPEVQMTSQGAGAPLNAFEEIDAARACMFLGNIRISTISSEQEALTEIHNNDKAFYKYLDFKEGADSILIRVAPGEKPCRIDLAIDSFTSSTFGSSSSIGSVEVPARKADNEWITVKAAVEPTKGVHALRIGVSDPERRGRFIPGEGNQEVMAEVELCKIDAFQFK